MSAQEPSIRIIRDILDLGLKLAELQEGLEQVNRIRPEVQVSHDPRWKAWIASRQSYDDQILRIQGEINRKFKELRERGFKPRR